MPKALPIDKQGPSWEKTEGEGFLVSLRRNAGLGMENMDSVSEKE